MGIMFEKLNNNKKDIYKVLVQTSENKLPTPDKTWDGVIFKRDAVEKAVSGLNGKLVYDNTISSHADVAGSMNHTIFGQIIASEIDELGNAYAHIDVFNKDYVSLMDKLAENYNNKKRLDEGFSTEMIINDKVINPDNSVDVVDYNYTGLSFVNNPRDFSGVEGKIVNTILPSKNNNGGTIMGETISEPVISSAKAMKLVEENATLKAQKENWEKTEKGYKTKITSLKKELTDKNDEITKLNNNISEYKKADEKEILILTNSILKRVDEENKEIVKKTLENTNLETLRLINSMSARENDKEVLNDFTGVTNPFPNTKNNTTAGKSAYEQATGVDISDLWGDDD